MLHLSQSNVRVYKYYWWTELFNNILPFCFYNGNYKNKLSNINFVNCFCFLLCFFLCFFFRFTSSEKIRMFGIEGTPEYAARIQKYREWTVNKLVSVTNKFIQSICENIHCFPSSVCWLVRHMYKLLTEAGKLPEKEVSFTNFIFYFFLFVIWNYSFNDHPVVEKNLIF